MSSNYRSHKKLQLILRNLDRSLMSLDCIVFQAITTEGINAFRVIFCILLNLRIWKLRP